MKNTTKKELLELFLGDDFQDFELKEFLIQLGFLAICIVVGSLFS